MKWWWWWWWGKMALTQINVCLKNPKTKQKQKTASQRAVVYFLAFFHMFSCSSTSFTGNHVHKKCGQHTALEVKPAEKQGWKATHPLVQG